MRFVKFAVVGVANTAISFVVFNLAAIGLHMAPLWANALAWLAGFANSFIWNRLWTFADRRTGPVGTVLLRFAAANALALAVSTLIIVVLQAAAGLPQGGQASALELNLIEAVAISGALTVNYLVSLRWVFQD
jgi:putative flippase GtrA